VSRESSVPVAEAWDAIARLDADALIALCDPAVTFESRITAVEEPTYRGHDGIRRYVRNLSEAFDWIEVERSDGVEDGGRAVFTNRFRGRGRGSGVEVEQRYFVAMSARGGKLVSWRFFDSRAEALHAVDLRE
jgi:ketosteroid isomerase-like protein